MAITKSDPSKKFTPRTTAENPRVSEPARAAERTEVNRQIRVETGVMEPIVVQERALPEPFRISPELRLRMIQDAAYFRAEQRRFTAGDPVRDWLEAEAEIDGLLQER